MSAVFMTTDRRTRLGVLLLDVLLTEEVEFESQATLYPVEDGTEISDHITQGAEKIRIGGVVSTADASGGFGIAATLGFGVDNSAKLIDVIEALRTMHKNRELVTVSTGQLVYEQMAFTSLNAQRSADGQGGNWVSVKAELVKIRKVSLKTADVPAPENIIEAGPAGRAGETNKPAGRSTPSGASGANTNANQLNNSNSTFGYRLQNSVQTAAPDSFTGNVRDALRGIAGR